MNLYTLYDVVAEESGPIFEAKNDAIAWRMVKAIDTQGIEFKVYRIGYYDHGTAVIKGYTSPIDVIEINKFVEDLNEAI